MSAFARSYAHAFLESAPAGYSVEGFLENAGAIRRALAQDRRLKAFFGAPTVPREAKKRVLDELAERAALDDFGRRFFAVALENRRILQIPEILAEIGRESDRRRGIVEAHVTVAAPVSLPERERITAALSRASGRQVRVTMDVDAEILAGFVARIGSEIFDASVATAIDRFAEEAKV